MFRKYFQLSQQFLKTPGQTNSLRINCENVLPKRWAGHSKWQNIKSTKEAADRNRAIAFQKIVHQVSYAVKKDGPNPATNSKLKALIEESKKINMPKATIESVIKSAQSQTTDKPFWVVFTGPKGIVLGFEVIFANNKPGFLQAKLGSFTKKLNLKFEPHFYHLCNERGLIITDPMEQAGHSYDTALEDAIEIGMDEVHERDDKSLIFECSPERVDSYAQKITQKGYNVQSSSVELDFKDFVTLKEEEIMEIEKLIKNVQNNFVEVLRASYNVAEN